MKSYNLHPRDGNNSTEGTQICVVERDMPARIEMFACLLMNKKGAAFVYGSETEAALIVCDSRVCIRRSSHLPTRATTLKHYSNNTKQQTAKKVCLGKVRVREYEVILGDHPCCEGLPLSLGWKHANDDIAFECVTQHIASTKYKNCHSEMIGLTINCPDEAPTASGRGHRHEVRKMTYEERKERLKTVQKWSDAQLVCFEQQRFIEKLHETNTKKGEELIPQANKGSVRSTQRYQKVVASYVAKAMHHRQQLSTAGAERPRRLTKCGSMLHCSMANGDAQKTEMHSTKQNARKSILFGTCLLLVAFFSAYFYIKKGR
jgi:hypothetical protein